MVTRIQNRRDLAASWVNKNPILEPGEIGFETDTQQFKIGIGSLWNDTKYQIASDNSEYDYLVDSKESWDNLASGIVTGKFNILVSATNLEVDKGLDASVIGVAARKIVDITFAAGAHIIYTGSISEGDPVLKGFKSVRSPYTTATYAAGPVAVYSDCDAIFAPLTTLNIAGNNPGAEIGVFKDVLQVPSSVTVITGYGITGDAIDGGIFAFNNCDSISAPSVYAEGLPTPEYLTHFIDCKNVVSEDLFVARVSGKDLSDNNYEDTEKVKVANVPYNTISELLELANRTSTSEQDIENLEANQISGVLYYSTKAIMLAADPTGQAGSAYKVIADSNTALNGDYSSDGASYTQQTNSVDGVIESGNVDATSGGAVYDAVRTKSIAEDLYTIQGRYIHKDSGLEDIDGTLMVTDFLPITGDQEILLDMYNSGNASGLYFYSKDKTPISALNQGVNQETKFVVDISDIPTNSEWIRATSRKNTVELEYNVHKGVSTLSILKRIDEVESQSDEYNAFYNISAINNDYNYPSVNDAIDAIPIAILKKGACYVFFAGDTWRMFNYKGDVVLNDYLNFIDKDDTSVTQTSFEDYVYAIVDENDILLFWIDKLGQTNFYNEVMAEVEETTEYVYAITDDDNQILFGITTDGKCVGLFDGSSSSSSGENNLLNQDASGITINKGGYSAEDTIYSLPITAETFRVVFDFYIRKDVNSENTQKPIVDFIYNNSSIGTLDLKSAETEDLFRTHPSSPGLESTLLQCPKYNSGFTIFGEDNTRDSLYFEPLVGETIMLLWLKGNESPLSDYYGANKITGESTLAARESWLNSNQDYSILIANDTLSIIRDGIDVTEAGGVFNGGATSTVFSTSLKNLGEWKEMKDLYNELIIATSVGGVLYNIVQFTANDFSSRKTCEDIHQFGKIKMVGRYYQQITNIDVGYGDTLSMKYDSFPVPIKYSVDETVHTCEIVGMNNTLYAQVDGELEAISMEGISNIIIGGNAVGDLGGIKPFNLEYTMGNVKDAEVTYNGSIKTIISARSPYLVGIMGHYLVDDVEGNTGELDYLGQTLTRMEDTCIELYKKNYNVLTMREVINGRCCRNYDNKRSAFFVFDDRRVGNLYEDLRNRQSISKYGYPINLASIMQGEYEDDPDRYFKLFTSMHSNGWTNVSHTYFHNRVYTEKNSIILNGELAKILAVADELNMSNNSLVYSFGAGWDVTHTMLRKSGMAITVLNNFPYMSTLARNRYMLGRVNMADDASFNVLKAYLL